MPFLFAFGARLHVNLIQRQAQKSHLYLTGAPKKEKMGNHDSHFSLPNAGKPAAPSQPSTRRVGASNTYCYTYYYSYIFEPDATDD